MCIEGGLELSFTCFRYTHMDIVRSPLSSKPSPLYVFNQTDEFRLV